LTGLRPTDHSRASGPEAWPRGREERRINPDVVGAIARLRADGVLSDAQAGLFDRVARRDLVSVRLEIRALLYLGVLLLTSGVGVLLAQHQEEIGPVVIAGAIGLAAAGCLAWVAREAPAFSWDEVPAPSLAFDYVLLLGMLLVAADLAYIEAQFAVLGPRWAHHLLVVAAIYLAAAYRWDSRTVLALALSTLAAWRGLSVSIGAAMPGRLLFGSPGADPEGALRASAAVLGALYVAAAVASVRFRRKAHLEAVYATAGLLLLLGALVSGALGPRTAWPLWLAALLIAAGALAWWSLRLDRSLYFALAVAAGYLGLLRPLFAPFRRSSGLPLLLAALVGAGALVLIFAAHRRMRRR